MIIEVFLISKLSSELVTVQNYEIPHGAHILPFKAFQDMLYDTFSLRDNYLMYWRYSHSLFFEINDYATFTTALLFSAEKRLYVLLKDYDEPFKNNLFLMKILDAVAAKALMPRNPYNVESTEGQRSLGSYLLGDVEHHEQSRLTDANIIAYAVEYLKPSPYYTSDFSVQARLIYGLKQVCGYNLLNRLAVTTASFLCLTNILGMKGEIISCPHKDIYFLETNTKSESTDLANMFASPTTTTGRGHMIKCKPRTKLKQKYNPALDFFAENKETTKAASSAGGVTKEDGKCGGSGNQASSGGSRRNSIDLYEEAATILGLTCSQTDDCKCIECQCHYFDFEDDLDFTPLTSTSSSTTLATTGGGSFGGGEYYVDHNSSCAIQ